MITLAGLAKDLDINSGELSKTIKFYKKKRFNHYINTLRIDYLIRECDPVATIENTG